MVDDKFEEQIEERGGKESVDVARKECMNRENCRLLPWPPQLGRFPERMDS